jgi:hypothetical protein
VLKDRSPSSSLGPGPAGWVSNYLMGEAPLKKPQQPKYDKNDYHHDYNPDYAWHWFASFHMWLGLSFALFPLKTQRKITRDRSPSEAKEPRPDWFPN